MFNPKTQYIVEVRELPEYTEPIRKNLGHTFDGDDPLEAILLVDVTLVTSPNQKNNDAICLFVY